MISTHPNSSVPRGLNESHAHLGINQSINFEDEEEEEQESKRKLATSQQFSRSHQLPPNAVRMRMPVPVLTFGVENFPD